VNVFRFVVVFLLLCYAATGIFVVRGNEQALVRWFGKARPQLVSSGLRYVLPWPMCRVNRVNLSETRTITVGLGDADEVDDSDFLKAPASSRQSEYLTGDKNILHLQISVQYRIENPRQFLLEQENPERHLRYLVQSLVADAVSRSGVDYVHPLGLTALRQWLTQETRSASERQGVGVFVEDVTLADVRPPVSVKQAFLDVSNARAEKERLVSEAQTTSERLVATAMAQASQLQDQAETHRAQQLSFATSDASRFNALIDQFQASAKLQGSSYSQSKNLARQRLYWTTLETLLPKLAKNVYLDGDKPIDLTIQRSGK
jgi:membrane protease subunit HflK